MYNGVTIDLSQLLFSASMALDAVEQEVLGAVQNHCRRVAYLSVWLGKRLGFSNQQLVSTASYASLHDNALTEYITEQRLKGNKQDIGEIRNDLAYHCIAGEMNLKVFPFPAKEKNVILYHHENMDGSGMFGIKGEEIPLLARILRLADNVDVLYNLALIQDNKRSDVMKHVEENAGGLYDPALVPHFIELIKDNEILNKLSDENIKKSLKDITPVFNEFFSYKEIIEISSLFAHIIDYKSAFTLNHSRGIAEKTKRLAKYYEFDDEKTNKIYIAAFLHDIGKLITPEKILLKPGKLTTEEYEQMKFHVKMTHNILSEIDAIKDIAGWASGHHERLDGSGYFRGSTGDSQDFCTRMLCCVDVYQALVEERPYRAGMNHDEACAILDNQAKEGKLDKRIIQDISRIFSN